MPKVNLTIAHRLTQEEALKRVKALLSDAKTQYADKIHDLRENWNGSVGTFNLTVMGFSASGTLTVTPSALDVSGTVPFAAMLFKSKIETAVREKVEAAFA